MPTRKTTILVTCPNCGNHFALDDTIAGQLEQKWKSEATADLKAQLRKELAPELDKKAENKATILAQAKVREAEEKAREAVKRAAALQAKVTKLERSMPPERAQELGYERQRSLLEILTAAFPLDKFEPVGRGVAGADIVQRVSGGVGSILWESKKAASWQSGWVPKLLNDQKNGNHTVSVIVSDVLPDDNKMLMQLDGVWACKIDVAADLATVLRQGVIAVAKARGTAALRDDLKGQIYDYLVGPGFAERVSSIVMCAQQIRDSVATEKRAFSTRWAERERQAQCITEDVAHIIGTIIGLGAPVKVDALELNATTVLALPVEASAAPTEVALH